MKRILLTLKWIVIIFFASSILSVIIYKYVPVYYSPLMFIRSAQHIMRGEEPRLHHQWVSIDSISYHLPTAVWASEDQNFFKHNGFDMDAIQTAINEHKAGKRQRGASTISQQTAKNVFLWPSSTWTRKALEVYFTLLIEFFWSKERIMEVYLNTIEMGDGIYGAQAVAEIHFGRDASELSLQQATLIAASLPNPLKYDSSNPTRYMYKRQTWIIRQIRNLGVCPLYQNKKDKSKSDK